MTGLLGAISGHFTRGLILGAFFPVTILVFVGLLLVGPFVPNGWPFLEPLEAFDSQWKIIGITALIVLLTGLLYNLNVPLIRLYEGYAWEHTRPGKWRATHHTKRLENLQTACTDLERLLLRRGSLPRRGEVVREYNRLGKELMTELPDSTPALPTRLGNVIRAFEEYPRRQYGMAAVTLWPRLAASVDKEYASGIDDAKSTFDFMLNASVGCTLLAAILGLVGVAYATPLISGWYLGLWLIEIALLLSGAHLFYLFAVGRARAWGSTVKSAFDLYRWKLLEQFGFPDKPLSMTAERTLWTNISEQIMLGDAPDGPRVAYGQPPLSVRSTTADATLYTTRGSTVPNAQGQYTVTVQVWNAHPTEAAANVIVSDRLADGFMYIWGSARLNNTSPLQPAGTNPYRFNLGTIAHGTAATLTYDVAPRKQE
jgi:uncharacterized repeat protein (TIGR01451 family)